MPLTITRANAVDREADYLNDDLSPRFPTLLKDTSDPTAQGPFDSITPRLLRISQGKRQVHVWHESITELREATGIKSVTTDIMLGVLWPITNVERPDSTEQAELDNAVSMLVERIAGVIDDHTHGGRFWSAGEPGDMGGSRKGIEVRYQDWRTATNPIDAPLAAGAAYVVEVRYPVVDFLSEEP